MEGFPMTDEELIIFMMIMILAFVVLDDEPAEEYRSHRRRRRRGGIDRRTIPFTGIKRIVNPGGSRFALQTAQIFLDADHQAFKDQFRLSRPCFYALEGWYALHTNLHDTRRQTRMQKLLIFLWTLAFDEPQRNTAAKFRIAQSSVSEVINQCLTASMKLAKAFITMPEPDFVSPKVELNPRLRQFNGCIGALDGTHIPIHVPIEQRERFIGRNGTTTQKVFAAVCPAGRFQFVLAGGEGRMADTTLLECAIKEGFDVPPGRFYLADASFGLRQGILVPYGGARYHLEEWRAMERQPQNKVELFNRQMSGLRAQVEMAFGTLKDQWKIIRASAPKYSIRDQIRFVYACCALYNFIFDFEDRGQVEVVANNKARDILAQAKALADEGIRGVSGKVLRDQIADNLWPVRNSI